ncbi:MAG: hypothetical protein AUJ98_11690 [Bacteroidetes bacterium CG2_30_33_31]|nr:MAG: hypothetical protein AUJ98_11690 [Bacteroidetes bacterium CG2_30_33_31]
MNELIKYKVPFLGLNLGEHIFQFHITKKFFDSMQSLEEIDCDLMVNMLLNKQPLLMTLSFHTQGIIKFDCDLCLDKFDYNLDFKHDLIVKIGNKDTNNDDFIFISPTEYEIDVSQIIFEDIILNIPIRKVHQNDKKGNPSCNKEQLDLLEKFKNHKTQNSNWDALKDIKFEN